MRRRASRNISLVLIGTAALAGCARNEPPAVPTARDNYLNLSECTADWGRPEYCERQELTTNAGNTVFVRGPAYCPDDRIGAQRQARDEARRAGVAGVSNELGTNRSIGRTTTLGSSALGRGPASGATSGAATNPVARGGFGSTGRSFGSAIS